MATDLHAGPGDPGHVADFGIIEHAVWLGLTGRRRTDERGGIRGSALPTAIMAITSEEEWAERAAAFLKHKLRDCEVTYADLAKRLKKHGFKTETEASVTNKLARGSIPCHLVFGCPSGIGIGWRGTGGDLIVYGCMRILESK
jgi:hypothetical protein